MVRKILLAIAISVGACVGVAHAVQAPEVAEVTIQERWLVEEFTKPVPAHKQIAYRHGDCSWVPEVALQAGWKEKQLPKLIHIIQRESGCCPRRIGGSVVDANCKFIRMATWKHPSDSGLLQINGVHWKEDHAQYHGLVCKQMGICTQEPLLDALTNLRAGKLLFDVAGWSPWRLSSASFD